MRQHGYLFQAPLVRAILSGQKTMTRRPLYVVRKGQSGRIDTRYQPPKSRVGPEGFPLDLGPGEGYTLDPRRPEVGDVVWVRETHGYATHDRDGPVWDSIVYRADGEDRNGKWTPAIHMPRAAARIVLPVTRVRIERLHDISDADAHAEGIPCWVCGRTMDGLSEADCHCFHRKASAVDFVQLWGMLYGEHAAAANPWVQVTEWDPFKPGRP